jgi:hypothetical protein
MARSACGTLRLGVPLKMKGAKGQPITNVEQHGRSAHSEVGQRLLDLEAMVLWMVTAGDDLKADRHAAAKGADAGSVGAVARGQASTSPLPCPNAP